MVSLAKHNLSAKMCWTSELLSPEDRSRPSECFLTRYSCGPTRSTRPKVELIKKKRNILINYCSCFLRRRQGSSVFIEQRTKWTVHKKYIKNVCFIKFLISLEAFCKPGDIFLNDKKKKKILRKWELKGTVWLYTFPKQYN